MRVKPARVPGRSADRETQPLSAVSLWALFFVLLLVVFSRRPGDLLHAQFFAEDGKRWFAQAYNLSWPTSLGIPYSSYLQILPRLAAGVALCVPLRFAPLTMNLAGAALQVLPVPVLLSERCANWGSLRLRAVLALAYIAIPNAPEVHINMTNAQWHFVVLEVLLAFSSAPRHWLGRAVDVLLFLVGAFSGPFCIVLLPLLLFFWWRERQRWTLVLAACLAVGTVVQVRTILYAPSFHEAYETGLTTMPERQDADRIPLGATPSRFVKIVGGDIVLNSVIGSANVDRLPVALSLVFLLLGLLVVAYGLRWAPLPFRLFAATAILLTAASLRSPDVFGYATRWAALVRTAGIRYYFLPSLLFLWACIYCAFRAPEKGTRYLAFFVLGCAVLGAIRRWEYAPLPDRHFAVAVVRVQQAHTGERIVIPIEPQPWTMTLIKH